jgi:hypothetical protein
MFGAYLGLLLAVLIAGFLAAAVGTWVAVLWGVALLAGLAFYLGHRLQRPPVGDR